VEEAKIKNNENVSTRNKNGSSEKDNEVQQDEKRSGDIEKEQGDKDNIISKKESSTNTSTEPHKEVQEVQEEPEIDEKLKEDKQDEVKHEEKKKVLELDLNMTLNFEDNLDDDLIKEKIKEQDEEVVCPNIVKLQYSSTPKTENKIPTGKPKSSKKQIITDMIADRDKTLFEKEYITFLTHSKLINKLKVRNNNIIAKLRPLSIELDVIRAKNKELMKPRKVIMKNDCFKGKLVYEVIEKIKELETLQEKVAVLHKEVRTLKAKMNSKTGYVDLVDLENKVKEADAVYEKYVREYSGLEMFNIKQSKDLNSLVRRRASTGLIGELHNKLERKVHAEARNSQKQHENCINLQERLQKVVEQNIA
jgi:23S rRNA maturation mini-RNase III